MANEVIANFDLFKPCFNKKVLKSLKSVIKDLNIIPDYNYMRNIAGQWHTDSAYEQYEDYISNRLKRKYKQRNKTLIKT